MRLQAILLALLTCSACGPDAREGVSRTQRFASADAATLSASNGANTDLQLAFSSRALFFVQVELFQAGADRRAGTPLAQMLATLGREDLIDNSNEPAIRAVCARRWVDPIKQIGIEAESTSIVIIGESDDEPRHRAYVKDVVNELYGRGYRIYAAEALGDVAKGRLARLPLEHEGILSREPMFGRLIRRVKALDLEVVEFAQSPEEMIDALRLTPAKRTEARNKAQLKNLMREVFSERPRAKVIIHIGGRERDAGETADRHIQKQINWLARQLEAETRVRPLTISQTPCRAQTSGAAIVATEGEFVGSQAAIDMTIGHPASQMVKQRPSWRRAMGDNDVNIPASFLKQDVPVIVEARRSGESAIVVPEDRVLILPGENLPLLLPKGNYRIEAWSKDGAVAPPVEVMVR